MQVVAYGRTIARCWPWRVKHFEWLYPPTTIVFCSRPAELASYIPEKQIVRIRYEPLDYEFQQEPPGLAIRIINSSAKPVMLLGNRSYVVDPEGESRPLPARAIGLHSYMKMDLPPRPAGGTITTEPRFTFGIGTGWEWGNHYWGYP